MFAGQPWYEGKPITPCSQHKWRLTTCPRPGRRRPEGRHPARDVATGGCDAVTHAPPPWVRAALGVVRLVSALLRSPLTEPNASRVPASCFHDNTLELKHKDLTATAVGNDFPLLQRYFVAEQRYSVQKQETKRLVIGEVAGVCLARVCPRAPLPTGCCRLTS